MNKKIILLCLTLLLLSSCADKINVPIDTTKYVFGFWGGVFHGSTMLFSFIWGFLFDDTVAVYAINNNGAWYDFGFVGGLGLIISFIRGFNNK